MNMLSEFKFFLTKTNALALAIGVVIGAAIGKVVSSLVADLIMPLVGLVVPKGGSWRDWAFGAHGEFKFGNFLSSLIDFVFVALVVFFMAKALLREAKPPAAPPTKPCPECLEQVPLAAKRCRACTSPLL